MPELPDITVYIEALRSRIVGDRLERALIKNPFLLRTAVPPISACENKDVLAVERIGKRIAIGLEDDLWIVLHLMIAGRLHWLNDKGKGRKGSTLAEFTFTRGTLSLTEAGTKRRASLHV